jgi:hypothetical protein
MQRALDSVRVLVYSVGVKFDDRSTKGATMYARAYRDGYAAGEIYTFRYRDTPATLYRDEAGRRSVRGHGRMDPARVAGWMRGFRHAIMDAQRGRI